MEKFSFPFHPYSIQEDFMQSLNASLDSKKVAVMESPTGTGKSMSLICGSMTWLTELLTGMKNEVTSLDKQICELEKDPDWIEAFRKKQVLSEKSKSLTDILDKLNSLDAQIEHWKESLNEVKTKKKRQFSQDMEEEGNEEDDPDDDIGGLETLSILPNVISDKENEAPSWLKIEKEPIHLPKIIYASRTHSQLAQFVNEFRKTIFPDSIKASLLTGRTNVCLNESVAKLKVPSLVNDKCLELKNNCSESSGEKRKTDNIKTDGRKSKQKSTSRGCPFYNHDKIENVKNAILSEPCDLEDLVRVGKEHGGCPYYASRRAAIDGAQLILVPYNLLLSRTARQASGLDLTDAVVIIDEAHNLVDAINDIHSVSLKYNAVKAALDQTKQYFTKYETRFSALSIKMLRNLIVFLTGLKKFCESSSSSECSWTVTGFLCSARMEHLNIHALSRFIETSQLTRKLHGFKATPPIIQPSQHDIDAEKKAKALAALKATMQKPKARGKTTTKIQSRDAHSIGGNSEETPSELPPQQTYLSPLCHVMSFLDVLCQNSKEGKVVLYSDPETTPTVDGPKNLRFVLLSSASRFQDVITESRSVVLAGGTMSNLADFRVQLGLPSEPSAFSHFSCGHVIPPSQLLVTPLIGVSPSDACILTRKNLTSSVRKQLGVCLLALLGCSPGGFVVFFPSGTFLRECMEDWDGSKGDDNLLSKLKSRKSGGLFIEPKYANQVDAVLTGYSESISRPGSTGALLFAVVGGKLSEGINFADDLARTVVILGLPYPNPTDPELRARMTHLNSIQGSGAGQRFYTHCCVRAINQSIGRCIRHAKDHAAIVLFDRRYLDHHDWLPDWMKPSATNQIASSSQSLFTLGPVIKQLRSFFSTFS